MSCRPCQARGWRYGSGSPAGQVHGEPSYEAFTDAAVIGRPSGPRVHKGGSRYAASAIAELLADLGRVEEAVDLLGHHAPANSGVLAGYLIDLGRIEEAVAHPHQTRSIPLPPADRTYTDAPPF